MHENIFSHTDGSTYKSSFLTTTIMAAKKRKTAKKAVKKVAKRKTVKKAVKKVAKKRK